MLMATILSFSALLGAGSTQVDEYLGVCWLANHLLFIIFGCSSSPSFNLLSMKFCCACG